MIKLRKFFRFLRGELNGYYIKNAAYCSNVWAEGNIYQALTYMRNVQFDIDNMSTEDIFNVAKFAGITQLLVKGPLDQGTLKMTGSEIVNGRQYSERGLWNLDKEVFEFVRTTAQEYTTDIVTETSTQRLGSLVPSGYEPTSGKKYIYFGERMYDEEGNFLSENLHPAPPSDPNLPYTEYYGPNFLVLAENIIVLRRIPPEALYNTFCIIQRIRYAGSSTQLFAELTETIVGDRIEKGFVKLVSSETEGNHIIWTYNNYEQIEAKDKIMRATIWENLVASFFPQIVLKEIIV